MREPLEPRTDPHRVLWIATILLCIVAGAFLRIVHLETRAFRADELWMAELIDAPSWEEVQRRIDGHKEAIPAPLYVLASYGMGKWLGAGPFGMRVLPCAAGILALAALVLFLRRFTTWRRTAATCFVVTFSIFFVYWSKDAKPYTSDLLLFLGLGLALERARDRGYTIGSLVPAGVLAIFTAGFSYASFLAFPIFGAVLGLEAVRRRGREGRNAFAFAAFLAGLLALLYFTWLRHRRNAYLDQFWSYYSVPRTNLSDVLEWHLWRGLHFPNRLLNQDYSGLLGWPEALLAIVAFLILARGVFALRCALPLRFHLYAFGPIAVAYVLGALGIAPFEDRLLVFALVLPLLYFVAGIGAFAQAMRPWSRGVLVSILVVIGALFVLRPVQTQWMRPASGSERLELQDDLLKALRETKATDIAWYELATTPARCYFDYRPKTPNRNKWLGLPDWLGFPFRHRHIERVRAWMEEQPNSWAVLIFRGDRGPDLDRHALMNHLDRQWEIRREFEATNVQAFLLERRQP